MPPGHARHQRQIFLVHVPVTEHAGQGPPRGVMQRQNDQPGRILVQTVHNARPLAPLIQQGGKTMGGQMNQRGFPDGRRGMHGQPGGFVDDGQTAVSVQNRESPLVGRDRPFRLFGRKLQCLAGNQPRARLDAHPAVDGGPPLTNPVLNARPGHALFVQTALPEDVQPPAAVGEVRFFRPFPHDVSAGGAASGVIGGHDPRRECLRKPISGPAAGPPGIFPQHPVRVPAQERRVLKSS